MNSLCQFLLQTSDPISEVAEFLYPVSGSGPLGKAGKVVESCKEEIHKLIYANLDFDRFRNEEGDFLNYLPEEFKLDVKDKIAEEYQAFIDSLDIEALIHDAESGVLGRVEEYAWRHGIKVLPEALHEMSSNLARCAGEYDRMIVPADATRLQASYDKAMKNTLVERMAGTNSDDLLVYRQDLIEYLEEVCSVGMYGLIERFYSILSCSSVIIDLKSKLEDIIAYLKDSGLEEGNQVMANDSKEVLGVVFTDLNETEPAKTLNEYVQLLSKNR